MFRFMLPQRGLGEHPLSPGMPLLISAAINQFSSSHQPHRHPLHLLLLFPLHFCTPTWLLLLLRLFPFAAMVLSSEQWQGGGWSHLDPPPSSSSSPSSSLFHRPLDSNGAGGRFHKHRTIIQRDLKLTRAHTLSSSNSWIGCLYACMFLATAHFSYSKHMVIPSKSAEACEQCELYNLSSAPTRN